MAYTIDSRGVRIYYGAGRIVQKPIEWYGDYVPSASELPDTNSYTWGKGMPRIHEPEGTLYKISEMDPAYDADMIADQIIRLLALKAILDNNPDCRIPGYDYSAIDEIPCTSGAHEVLEYCLDGITEKRWRDCINSVWIYNEQKCPDEPSILDQILPTLIIAAILAVAIILIKTFYKKK